ncbi:hypothetical protein NL492_26725, partial [Klebsiella pneumoniae]|nr:hypothetical protein [Klebsiella pneumoniae]
GDLRRGCLHLQDELDAFDGSDGGLGHGGGDTAGQKVLCETVRVFGRFGFGHFLLVCCAGNDQKRELDK